MEQLTPRAHTPSILLMLANLLGALVLFGGALTLALQGVVGMFEGRAAEATASFMLSGGMLFTGALTLPGAFYSLRRLMGRPTSDQPAPRHGPADWLMLLGAWPLLVAVGSALIDTPAAWLFMPVISVAAVAIPVVFTLRLAASQLKLGTRQRAWGILGLGLTLSPFIILVFELAVLIVIVLLVLVVLSLQPEQLENLVRLSTQMETMNEEQLLQTLAPALYEPLSLLAIFGFVAVAVPLIEELFKTLPLWFFGRRLNSMAEGFAMGAISGAAFALFENIGYAANDTSMWASTTLARIGAGGMHILTGGLMGWGLAAAFLHRKYLRLAAAYLVVVLIHGVWNAMGVGLGLGVLSGMVTSAPDFWRTLPIAALGALLSMGVGAFWVLMLSNRRMLAEQRSTLADETPPME